MEKLCELWARKDHIKQENLVADGRSFGDGYHKKKLNKQYLYAKTMNTISKFLLENNIAGQTLDFSCDLERFMVG